MMMIEHALAYAARGWPVFPVYEPSSVGVCSCPRGNGCPRIAKHPRTENGLTDATTDPEVITRWWGKWPRADIGIVTGPTSGIMVVDVDGEEGAQRLANFEALHGPMPTTPETITGSGGRHILVRHVAGFRNSQGKSGGILGAGLDVRADGGYIVAPPSVHANGNAYAWRTGPDVELAECPRWIVDLERARVAAAQAEARRRAEVKANQGPRASDFKAAADAYNAAHAREFSRHVSPCPTCPSPDGFKAHIVAGYWSCFSSQHQKHHGGMRRKDHYMGTVLDIDSVQRGRTPHQHLLAEGYLADAVDVFRANREQRLAAAGGGTVSVVASAPAPTETMATVTPIRAGVEPEARGLSTSFASLCEILRTPSLSDPVLRGRRLEFNEMSGAVCLDRVPVQDNDEARAMELIELAHSDRKGNGLCFGLEKVHIAFDLVARERPFHPVREYLDRLEWDGEPRLADVPKDILNSLNTELDRAVVRRWMISAVARAYVPGCQADSMLVLVGTQGSGKSTFLRALAGDEWFSDTAIDIHNKDSFSQLRGVWLYEWAELEPMNRARDEDAVKNFITSRIDNYRAAYARNFVRLPRSTVLAGTTNREDFLRDPTGNRRFWPIVVGHVDIAALLRTRDQLWAEAADAYHRGEQWHLTEREAGLLATAHEHHEQHDSWEPVILDWMTNKTESATGEIMEGALQLPPGRWAKADEHRLGRVLRRLGFKSVREKTGKRRRVWARA